MTKKEINVFDYAEHILKALPKGILVTAKASDKVNSMTIGWGALGIDFSKPIFTVYLREGRCTRELVDQSLDFTVNIPYGEYNKKIIGLAGTKSGHDMDKIKEIGLTPVQSDIVTAPGIKELPLTLECKVVYRQLQNKESMKVNMDDLYPQDVPSTHFGANKDYHVAYYGEIVKAYIIED